MKKSSKTVDIYSPNKQVTVRVTHTPKYKDDVFETYNRSVTILIRLPQDKNKLEFNEPDSISKFVETIEFEDPQQEMDFKTQ